MLDIKMYRIRYIPQEEIDISNDDVIFISDDVIVTRWNPIKPRKDFSKGISYIYFNEGYKISSFMDSNGNHLYWYCDIIRTEINKEKNVYKFYDLLIDIKINNNGFTEILDMDELGYALKNNIIDKAIVCDALEKCDKLLKIIYKGELSSKTFKIGGKCK